MDSLVSSNRVLGDGINNSGCGVPLGIPQVLVKIAEASRSFCINVFPDLIS